MIVAHACVALYRIALSSIEQGGAAFTISPNSLGEGKAAAASIAATDREWCQQLSDDDYRTALAARIRPAMSDDPLAAREILCDAGDVVIINPMCLHSASPMRLEGKSRYVCFNTFIDANATFILLPERGATRPAEKFPQELRTGLAAKGLSSLLEWAVPKTPDTQRRRFFLQQVMGAKL